MTEILCTIYRSSKEDELYLYVKRGTDLELIPEDLLKRFGKTTEVMTIKLNSEKKLARVSSTQVLNDIEEKGYFIQLPAEFNPHMTYGE